MENHNIYLISIYFMLILAWIGFLVPFFVVEPEKGSDAYYALIIIPMLLTLISMGLIYAYGQSKSNYMLKKYKVHAVHYINNEENMYM